MLPALIITRLLDKTVVLPRFTPVQIHKKCFMLTLGEERGIFGMKVRPKQYAVAQDW